MHNLYNDSSKREIKIAKTRENYYQNICTFSPEINDKTPSSLFNFFERMQNFVNKKNKKHEKTLELQNFDPNTGNKLFSPRLNSNNSSNRYLQMNKIQSIPDKHSTNFGYNFLIYPETEV